jgi:hypothetical protein
MGLYLLLMALIVVFFSFLIVEAATIALMMTGMDEKDARFQALSAFTRTGFTTREAESIVNHPVRRRIVSWLMILGNAGIVTIIVTFTSSLISSKGPQLAINIFILLAGVYLIYWLATRRGFRRKWEKFIENRLIKTKSFKSNVTEDLLHFVEGYSLLKVIIDSKSLFLGKTLFECKLTAKGMLILGIERRDDWVSIPSRDETFREGDRLIVYGEEQSLRETFRNISKE